MLACCFSQLSETNAAQPRRARCTRDGRVRCALCGLECRGKTAPCPVELSPDCAVFAHEKQALGDPAVAEKTIVVSNLERPFDEGAIRGGLPPRARAAVARQGAHGRALFRGRGRGGGRCAATATTQVQAAEVERVRNYKLELAGMMLMKG